MYLLYHQKRGYKSKIWNSVVESEKCFVIFRVKSLFFVLCDNKETETIGNIESDPVLLQSKQRTVRFEDLAPSVI